MMDLNNTTTPPDEQDLAQTPWWLIRAIEKMMGFQFVLDTCCIAATAKCDAYYSLIEDGTDSLVLPWSSHNWCNPPYSDITPWIHKAAQEARDGNISVLLIPDKPETKNNRLCDELADTIYHMPFRLNFLRPDGSPFLTDKGGKQGPKFPVMVALFTPWGLDLPCRHVYRDFRQGIDAAVNKG